MHITPATPSDPPHALPCLVDAFAADPITGFLLQAGPDYRARLTQFFSLLMGARMALGMPVLVGKDAAGVQGAAMGYTTARPAWPAGFAADWERFEANIPGFGERLAHYEEIADKSMPAAPHYYLGVIGTRPNMQGQGLGGRLLKSFCDLSAADGLSGGVYLETANPSNVRFYERAGFVVSGQGSLGDATLWCMFLRH